MACMLLRLCALLILAIFFTQGAQAPLPGLRVEAIDAGSVLHVRNSGNQPLVAYLIELVGYPGSSFSLWRDEPASPILPGVEKRIQIVNMTVGAAPEYVKMQAAVYADGSVSGIAEKAAQIVERRRFVLETTRELIRRIEKARQSGTAAPALIAELKQWSESLPPAGRAKRGSQQAINQTAGRELIAEVCAKAGAGPLDVVLAGLRSSETALAGSKPTP